MGCDAVNLLIYQTYCLTGRLLTDVSWATRRSQIEGQNVQTVPKRRVSVTHMAAFQKSSPQKFNTHLFIALTPAKHPTHFNFCTNWFRFAGSDSHNNHTWTVTLKKFLTIHFRVRNTTLRFFIRTHTHTHTQLWHSLAVDIAVHQMAQCDH